MPLLPHTLTWGIGAVFFLSAFPASRLSHHWLRSPFKPTKATWRLREQSKERALPRQYPLSSRPTTALWRQTTTNATDLVESYTNRDQVAYSIARAAGSALRQYSIYPSSRLSHTRCLYTVLKHSPTTCKSLVVAGARVITFDEGKIHLAQSGDEIDDLGPATAQSVPSFEMAVEKAEKDAEQGKKSRTTLFVYDYRGFVVYRDTPLI